MTMVNPLIAIMPSAKRGCSTAAMWVDAGTYVAALRFALIAHTTVTKVKTIAAASCHQSKLIAKPIQNRAAVAALSQVAMRAS